MHNSEPVDAHAERVDLGRGKAADLAQEVVVVFLQAGRGIGRQGLLLMEDAKQGVSVIVREEELVNAGRLIPGDP